MSRENRMCAGISHINISYPCIRKIYIVPRAPSNRMNLQQLEYIVALDIHRNYVRAADHCHVTQPTLSMMVKKLEDELGVKLFEKIQPLKPTPQGEFVIGRARLVLQEIKNLKEFIREEKE